MEKRLAELSEDERRSILPAISSSQEDAGRIVALINLPSPMDVFNPVHERIARVISKVTGEKTLTQLYFDWGIVKSKPEASGSHMLNLFLRERHPHLVGTPLARLPEAVRSEWHEFLRDQEERKLGGLSREEFRARQFWDDLCMRLHEERTVDQRYLALPVSYLKRIDGILMDLRADIQTALKRG